MGRTENATIFDYSGGNCKRQKCELKASEDSFTKNSDIFNKLYFSSETETKYFQTGETIVVRVFLGNKLPKVLLFNNEILQNGKARVENEYRAKIKGKKDYSKVNDISI